MGSEMRNLRRAAAALVAAASLPTAFSYLTTSTTPLTTKISRRHLAASHLFSSAQTEERETTPCDIPEEIKRNDLTSQRGAASILRSARVTNVDGMCTTLGENMDPSKNTNIVI